MNKLLTNAFLVAVVIWTCLISTQLAHASDHGRPQEAKGKTIVLVHGAFADGSSWEKVIRILQDRGLNVVAVQNPLNSLAADVAAVTRVVNQQGGSITLVGHSWGGAVITQAGNNPHVKSLVYVSAFALDAGQSINLLLQNLPAPAWFAEVKQDEGHYLTLSRKGMDKFFAPDLPSRDIDMMTATQAPWFGGCLADTVTEAAWRTKRSWWVLSEDDQIIDPQLQRAMAAQINAIVTPVKSSHAVMLSHPHKVARVILDAAGVH